MIEYSVVNSAGINPRCYQNCWHSYSQMIHTTRMNWGVGFSMFRTIYSVGNINLIGECQTPGGI
jgi:hypothetical protein